MPWFELETDLHVHSSQFAELKIHQEAAGRFFLQITLKDGRIFYRGPFAARAGAPRVAARVRHGTRSCRTASCTRASAQTPCNRSCSCRNFGVRCASSTSSFSENRASSRYVMMNIGSLLGIDLWLRTLNLLLRLLFFNG